MRIGGVDLPSPFAVAPMAGMTDTAFRRLVKRHGGCGLVVTEMVSSEPGTPFHNDSIPSNPLRPLLHYDDTTLVAGFRSLSSKLIRRRGKSLRDVIVPGKRLLVHQGP